MITIDIKKEDFKQMMFPLKYKNALIFANEFNGVSGLYGITENTLFFIREENLESIFQIEVPETIEELAEYTKVIEFAVQKIAINGGVEVPESTPSDQKSKLEPFVTFMLDYEKGLHIIEGLKNGII